MRQSQRSEPLGRRRTKRRLGAVTLYDGQRNPGKFIGLVVLIEVDVIITVRA